MKDQHTKIKGYRELSQEEIDLMNAVKAKGEDLRELIDKLRGTNGIDQDWVTQSEYQLKQGVMALVRAIAQPTTF